MNLLPNLDLQPLNTLAVPSRAELFCRAQTLLELREALSWAAQQCKFVSVLGGGSNVLLAEAVSGLVVQPALLGRQVVSRSSGEVELAFGAGENWHQVVQWTLQQGFFGLENLALIPGSMGAAPVQNIGAYGVELRDCFLRLEALNRQTLELEDFDHERCQFDYRESVFKQSLRERFIITRVYLRLRTEPQVKLDYPALREALEQCTTPGPQDVFDAVCRIRAAKLPDPAAVPNCGSFFKNPVMDGEAFERLRQCYPDVVAFDLPAGRKKVAAAWLIDRAGWKGKEVEGARVHAQQALVLTNPARRSLNAVLALAQAIQADIAQRFAVDLEIEPQRLGWPAQQVRAIDAAGQPL